MFKEEGTQRAVVTSLLEHSAREGATNAGVKSLLKVSVVKFVMGLSGQRGRVLFILTTAIICMQGVIAKSATGTKLRDDNWNDMLKGEWMVKFYAPWCPACRNLEPTWTSLAVWAVDKELNVGDVDVTEEPGLSGRFIITSLPTIYHVIDGEFRVYSGPRTLDDFLAFVNERKWKETSSISWWKSPSSTMMGYVSSLFQLSMHLKNLHNTLTDTYGVPVWASFVLFGVIVILMGLLLGVVLVLITDYTFGPPDESAKAAEETEGDDDQELLYEQDQNKEVAKEAAESSDNDDRSSDGKENEEDRGSKEQLRKRKVKQKASAD